MKMVNDEMKISLLDVQQVFNDLLNHKISREDAEEWARKRMNALVNQDLTFDPPMALLHKPISKGLFHNIIFK
ncbi:hypothetical protein [Acinetobacter baumannii]|uniref:hypothetical protein n=1 Tax=Acinetobacter baumannii TaxID=470 RepID=UPI001F09F0D7|nr:hypothetical protein [Acinetobacter baumannii]UMN22425.1 hypothetical protein L2Z07_09375 [Acinetobacter baumannii]